MNKESIQARRDAFAADRAANQAAVAAHNERGVLLANTDRTLDGAIQACDILLNDIREEESKSAEAKVGVFDWALDPRDPTKIHEMPPQGNLDAIAKEVADREARVAAQG